MDQVCINSPETITAVVTTVIAAAAGFANFIPAPDSINNTVLRGLSRIVHFIAFDIVTAAQKK